MGWTSYHVESNYKGIIDRKSEVDKRFTQDESVSKDKKTKFPKLEVVKSAMVGSTYYGAIKRTKDGKSKIFAVVCLTSVNNKDYYNFFIKEMDETVGPCQTKCPIGILNILTTTDNELANEWRNKCYEYHNNKKNKNSLQNLPLGTKIEVIVPFDTNIFHKGDRIILAKIRPLMKGKHSYWSGQGYKWPNSLIEGNYTVLNGGNYNG